MEMFEASEFPLQNAINYPFIDVMDEANFQHFIELIRGENADPVLDFNQNEQISCCLDETQFVTAPGELFSLDISTNVNTNHVLDSFPGNDKEGVEQNDIKDSSPTMTTTTKKKPKVDRSRTLISEQRRRGSMKEKLYALRSLVPNITKMNKASIVGDAVLYLQQRARNCNVPLQGS